MSIYNGGYQVNFLTFFFITKWMESGNVFRWEIKGYCVEDMMKLGKGCTSEREDKRKWAVGKVDRKSVC